MISENWRSDMKTIRRLLNNCRANMRTLSRKRCWWNWKKIDSSPKSITSSQISLKLPMEKVAGLPRLEMLVKLILRALLPRLKFPLSPRGEKAPANTRPKVELIMESHRLANSLPLSRSHLLLSERSTPQTQMRTKSSSPSTPTWATSKLSRATWWV